MKVKRNWTTTILCDDCSKELRKDLQLTKQKKEVTLYESVIHLGNGKHKCKSCYHQGFKPIWKINLNPMNRGVSNEKA